MRDTGRIYSFAYEFASLWAENFPDWRFGQLMYNFNYWLNATHGIDGFYLEEDRYLEFFKEYISKMFPPDTLATETQI